MVNTTATFYSIILQKFMLYPTLHSFHFHIDPCRYLVAEALQNPAIWQSCMHVDALDIILSLAFLLLGNIGWLLYLSGSIVQTVKGPRDGCITRCIPNPRSNTAAPSNALQHQNNVVMMAG